MPATNTISALLRPLLAISLSLSAFLPLTLSLASATTPQASLVVFADDFQFPGGWQQETNVGSLGGHDGILRATGSSINAITAVNVSLNGEYTIWARAVDYATTQPGTRRFAIAVNGQRLPAEAGRHGSNGWRWERIGSLPISAGDTAIEIIDTARHFARCDAILLTTDSTLDPNALPRATLLSFRVKPLVLKPVYDEPDAVATASPTAAAAASSPDRTIATLTGKTTRVSFLARGGAVHRVTEVKSANVWITVPAGNVSETLQLLHSTENNIDATRINPLWKNNSGDALRVRVRIGGHDYFTGSEADPWRAAPSTTLTARSARVLPDGGVELTFTDASGTFSKDKTSATSIWRVAPGGDDFEITTTLTAPADGYYSLAATPFVARERADVAFNLLPPLYQFQRLPSGPRLLTDTVTPQPLALIELLPTPDASRPSITLGVAAAPSEIPFAWPAVHNARYGFSLQSPDGLLQPAVFRPVLGLGDSQWKRGETHTVRWRVFARAGSWNDALAYADKNIFGVADDRHPVSQSLIQSVRNMIDLVRDSNSGGWDARLKGFWNIESPGTVTHAAPLALVSAAVLTDDEDLYATRALPAIEYMLTRPAAHFALRDPKVTPSYVNENSIRLGGPNRYFGTSWWQGLDALLGPGANPWIADLVRRSAASRPAQTWVTRFSQTLALWRLDLRPELLDTATRQAADWVAAELDAPKTRDLGYGPFYNHNFIPVWYDLLDLHDITGDARWLDAARKAGALTIAGLRSQPSPPSPDTPVLIHQNGRFTGNTHLWWRSDEKYRLGLPRHAGDVREKTVPARVVSPVGLGLEQPSTFFSGTKADDTGGFQNIMMSSWTPSLLRLYSKTGDTFFRDFARNGIVGRFGNYPGYYINGFTDLPQSARYPIDDPDVTSLYYHHIPPQLAFTLDWLFAEAELRSGGTIRFPWSRQDGYVWFNNRVFGQLGGEIFGERNARPLLPRGVTVDDPGLNWIAARTPEHFWIVLMNDASDPRPANSIKLDTTALHIASQTPVLVRTAAAGAADATPTQWTPSLTVPPRGLVALGYAPVAASTTGIAPALPPVAAKPITADLSKEWGKLQAWRIRSPFGKDSLYIALTGRPAAGATVELLLDDSTIAAAAPRLVDRFPYEITVYPFPHDSDARFRLRLTAVGGDKATSTTTTDTFILPGTSPQ